MAGDRGFGSSSEVSVYLQIFDTMSDLAGFSPSRSLLLVSVFASPDQAMIRIALSLATSRREQTWRGKEPYNSTK